MNSLVYFFISMRFNFIGIDPVGRRRLAELIHRESESRCVLITTHSMEEAEALCSRVNE